MSGFVSGPLRESSANHGTKQNERKAAYTVVYADLAR